MVNLTFLANTGVSIHELRLLGLAGFSRLQVFKERGRSWKFVV